MTVRAKVKCSSIKTYESYYQQKACIGALIEFTFVYHNNDPEHENSKFWDATPSGTFSMSINNKAAIDQLEIGKEYYIDIIPAS